MYFALAPHARPDVRAVSSMERSKTSAYTFVAPLVMTAALCGASQPTLTRLEELGNLMGEAYQVRDDVLGTFGSPATTGKSATSDLREGKHTLLIAFAQEDPAWGPVRHLFGDPALDDAGAQSLRDVIKASGALRKTGDWGAQVLARAVDLANDPLFPAPARDLLARVATNAWERER